MAEKAMLALEGRQRDESGEETVTRLRTLADYSVKNGSHYILYEEKLPDCKSVVKNLIKLKGSVLEMTKRGSVSSRMVFEAGCSHRTDYVTPYGILPLEVFTQELEILTREPAVDFTEPAPSGLVPTDRLAEPAVSGLAPTDRLAEPAVSGLAPMGDLLGQGLEIRLSYRLASGGQFLSHCTIAISLTSLHDAD